MKLLLTTPAAAEPISLTEAKAHLRVTSTDDDALISALISAATESAQVTTGRQLVCAGRTLYLDSFASRIRLPYAPLVTVDSVRYIDSGGTTQTLATTIYTADKYAEPGLIYEAYSQSWPATQTADNAVAVAYTAGYAAPFTASASIDLLTIVGRTFADGDTVRVWNSGGALPTGLAALTTYYVRDASGSTCKLASTAGGTAIDITAAGTGTHYIGVREFPPMIIAAIKMLVGHLYENREATISGTIIAEVPMGVQALLTQSSVGEVF